MYEVNKKHIVAVLCGLCLVVLYAGAAWSQQSVIKPEEKAKEHRIVRLNPISGADPATITVDKGATVIWVNESRSVAEIQFIDKQVTLACKNPTHFVINEEGAFISDRIPQGAVASLCFIETGVFDYVVLREPRSLDTGKTEPKLLQGKVIVK